MKKMIKNPGFCDYLINMMICNLYNNLQYVTYIFFAENIEFYFD